MGELSRRLGAVRNTLITVALLLAACGRSELALERAAAPGQTAGFEQLRKAMVEGQIRSRGVTHQGVLRAMLEVPRHEFVPPSYRSQAYDDRPLPIGLDQTISQPYIVARMTELVSPQPNHRVL